jgi:glucose-6-phosphate 1-dehydrogenase
VAADSTTETFVSTTLAIESWRWAGVPFHVRVGKCMPGNATEAVVELRRPPRLLFAGQNGTQPEPNLIRFRLGHDDGLTMSVQAKTPGALSVTRTIDLDVDFKSALGHRREAYERLLDDAMDGRRHRFAREDTIEEEWRIVEPILDSTERPAPYYKGTWGPVGGPIHEDDWHTVSVTGGGHRAG